MKNLIKFGIVLLLLSMMAIAALGQSKDTKVIARNSKEITRILTYPKYLGISERHASYWVKVSKLESAHYTSYMYKSQNNMWGMKYTRGRKTTKMTKGYKGFAKYDSLNDAYWDMAIYLKKRAYPKDFDDLYAFCTFLKSKGYFEEPLEEYYNTLKNIN